MPSLRPVKKLLPLLALVLVAVAGRDARAVGLLADAATPVELRLAVAIGPSRTTLWSEMRVGDSQPGPLALVVPVGFAYRLRFDLVMPQPLVWDLAAKVKPYLKDGDRLALLLPGDNGSLDDMLSGALTDVAPRRRLDLLHRQTADDATLAEAARLGYPLALISCTGDNAAALLEGSPEGWRRLASWPYPPEARAQRWQHILAWPPLCR